MADQYPYVVFCHDLKRVLTGRNKKLCVYRVRKREVNGKLIDIYPHKENRVFRVADATTVAGELTVPPSIELVTVNGKSLEPFGSGGVQVDVGGEHAGGAEYWLVLGAQSIGAGGVDGYDGCDGGGLEPIVGCIFQVLHAPEAKATPMPTIK